MLNLSVTALADAVLGYVKFLEGESAEMDVFPYHNGREHGYAILSHIVDGQSRLAVFSRDRASGRIVLYLGETFQFDANYSPLEDVYNSAEYFLADDAFGVAKAALAWLSGEPGSE